MNSATTLIESLGLERPPVAIAFRDSAPEGITRIETTAASGCTYWKHAAEGRTFYTEAADHYGCPIGSHTHGIDLPDEQAKELEGLIGTMVSLSYIDPNEVAGIPRRPERFGVVVYAPLADADFEPDVVLVTGTARQIMLLGEAAHAAGVGTEPAVVGRPTCAVIPAVMQSGLTATNFGCIGNRVYTELADDGLYFAMAGSRLNAVLGRLATIVHANRELETFHRGRVVA